MSLSRSIRQPSITNPHGRSNESIDDFINEVHLSFAHVKGAYTEAEDKETAHVHLIESHCAGKAGKFVRSLPARQKSTAANLIAALRSAFDSTTEDETKGVRAHRAMLELKQKTGEDPAKYARRARRISKHIDPKYDSLLTLKFRDGFKSRTLQMYLPIDSESPEKFTFEAVYKRFLAFDKINQRRQKRKEPSDPSAPPNQNQTPNQTRMFRRRRRNFGQL